MRMGSQGETGKKECAQGEEKRGLRVCEECSEGEYVDYEEG